LTSVGCTVGEKRREKNLGCGGGPPQKKKKKPNTVTYKKKGTHVNVVPH